MKPWTPDDCADATVLPEAEQRAIERAFAERGRTTGRRRKTPRPAFGSMVGLGLSLAFVAGLAWALTENSPVAREVRR